MRAQRARNVIRMPRARPPLAVARRSGNEARRGGGSEDDEVRFVVYFADA